ncbi:MAG: DNA repair protein RecO [Thermoproteota archaeon]
MARLVRDEGVVLAREDFLETDLLVTLFTRDHGKLVLLAKRARRLSMESGAYLDLTHRVEVIYYARRELPLLKEASLLRAFPRIHGEVERMESAFEGLAPMNPMVYGEVYSASPSLLYQWSDKPRPGCEGSPCTVGTGYQKLKRYRAKYLYSPFKQRQLFIRLIIEE